ncbi:MAG TPA: DUF885 domain-containing protein [Pyrinomonadaceae bacterium]|jgi:uncharacterized protein (DUF885 family)
MRIRVKRFAPALLAAALVWQAAPASASAARQRAAAGGGAQAAALNRLFEEEWEWTMREFPTLASGLGDRRYNDRWPDVSLAAAERRQQRRLQTLARLGRIDRARLGAADRLNYDLFRKDLENDVEEYKFGFHLMPVSQGGGVQSADQLGDRLRFQTVKDYDDWLARLRTFPDYVGQTTELMREGVRARMLWPKVTLQRVPAQLDRQLALGVEGSNFYKPFRSFPADIPEAERERLRREARAAVADGVIPALRRFREYFVSEYLPASFDRVGAWQWPNGAEAYAFLARRYTTTAMTPEQIHEKGLSEVARIRAEMQKVMTQVGFRGSLKDFFRKLRTDDEFYYKSPDELLAAYRAVAKRIDPNLVKVFKTIPRMPYGVIPIPDTLAPDTTTAYYSRPAADGSRPGYYFVNLYKPETRPRWEMMALSLHESVPGHHLQISRAMELGEVPKFRRYGGYTAYVEGWGLYAESLGEDMGLYDDPYSKFGQLTYEMWRAVRLVVDTGMHFYRWDRQKAIDYFLDNAAKTELDVTNEIDRYITDPGQALAYKIGELKLKELRARSKASLGDRFDLREFHDLVLGSGAVPLDVLEQNVNEWVARQAAARPGGAPPAVNRARKP